MSLGTRSTFANNSVLPVFDANEPTMPATTNVASAIVARAVFLVNVTPLVARLVIWTKLRIVARQAAMSATDVLNALLDCQALLLDCRLPSTTSTMLR